MSTEIDDKPRRRGVYLLPNLFTVAALFAGFYAIVAAANQNFEYAAIAILIALLLDGLDGRIARLTNSVTDFGAQFDSLSDMVCFGVTPALVLYSWSLSSLGKVGWLAAFIYTVSTALRLARFNTQLGQNEKRYFQGLSTTMAAGFVASILWVCTEYGVNGQEVAIEVAVMTLIISLLKVSTIPYRSFKDLDLRGKVPFIVIPVIVTGLVLISLSPPDALLLIFSSYVLSGPLFKLIRFPYRRRKRAKLKVVSSIHPKVPQRSMNS